MKYLVCILLACMFSLDMFAKEKMSISELYKNKAVLEAKRKCDIEKDTFSCINMIITLEENTSDTLEILKYYRKSCDVGALGSCEQLAVKLFLSGEIDEALTIGKKACERDSEKGCAVAFLSLVTKTPKPTIDEINYILSYLKKSCDLGSEVSCKEYAKLKTKKIQIWE